jgi:hypothetical protein
LLSGSSNRNTFGQRAERQDLGGAGDLGFDLGLAHLRQSERERHVLAHRHVRVERVVLEHHRDVALFGRQIVDNAVADADFTGVDLLEPGDHAQQRALAAARGADEHGERAVADVDVDAVQDRHLAEVLLHCLDRDAGHALVS